MHLLRKISGPTLLRFCFSGGHHKAPPTRLEKARLRVWLNVKNAYGEYERVAAFEGESLTQSLVRSNVSGCYAQCLGRSAQIGLHQRPQDPYTYGPGCKTCMVAIREPWKTQLLKELGKMDYLEKSVIAQTDSEDADMRIACYIPIEKWMKDMNVIMVETTDDDI